MARPKRGTKAGEEASRKYRETMAKKYGEDGVHKFFANIGSRGGRAGSTGGFAADPTKAILAGTIGGLRGKRAKSQNFTIVADGCDKVSYPDLKEIVSRCAAVGFNIDKNGNSAVIKIKTTEKIADNIVRRLGYLGVKATYEKA